LVKEIDFHAIVNKYHPKCGVHAQFFIVDGTIISAQPIYFVSPILILHVNKRTRKTSSPNLLTSNHLSGLSKMKWLETINIVHNSQGDSP
jgi:hypothetical protein